MLTKIARIILRAHKRNRARFRLCMKTFTQAAPVFLRPSELLSSDKTNQRLFVPSQRSVKAITCTSWADKNLFSQRPTRMYVSM